jgi:hypothetical protein
VAGALTNDSGPLLFVVAVFVLGVITAYVVGAPRASERAGALHSADPSAQDAPGAHPHPAPAAT